MANQTKDQGLALLQRNPTPGALFEALRANRVGALSRPLETGSRIRDVRNRKTASWKVKAAVALAVVAGGCILIGQKDVLFTRLGIESVPSLPAPNPQLSVDEQALYWTYAMFDIGKFRERFGVIGYYAINQAQARRTLENLVSEVSPAVSGQIASYTPIAYRTIKAGGRR